MSAVGTSRHFAAAQQFGRFLSEADIIGQARPAELVENDPWETLGWAAGFCGLCRSISPAPTLACESQSCPGL